VIFKIFLREAGYIDIIQNINISSSQFKHNRKNSLMAVFLCCGMFDIIPYGGIMSNRGALGKDEQRKSVAGIYRSAPAE